MFKENDLVYYIPRHKKRELVQPPIVAKFVRMTRDGKAIIKEKKGTEFKMKREITLESLRKYETTS